MDNQAFSKTWVIVIILILVGGGIFTWQYFETPKEEVEPEKKVSEESVTDETVNWKTYRNEEYRFEIKYPRDWGCTKLGLPNDSTVLAPQNVIMKIEKSLKDIESDKTLTIMLSVYEKILFERGILPYRGKTSEQIRITSSDINVGGINGVYYVSEYLQDKGSYIKGEKTATVDLPINGNYFSLHLFNYQYSDTFGKMLSTFRFLE
jgi:hypothetical protein